MDNIPTSASQSIEQRVVFDLSRGSDGYGPEALSLSGPPDSILFPCRYR
jgi:hypothetical protein